jgi:uncharacterized protein YjcR
MNGTDLEILEMYYKDGMKEKEIAKSVGVSLLIVHEVLAAHEWTEDDEWTEENGWVDPEDKT